MLSFEEVLENVMGKVAQRFAYPIALQNIDAGEVAATELLAGTRTEIPKDGQTA